MIKLVLLRHGQSSWNLENKFTGWKNVGLTKKGEEEAKEAGKLLTKENFIFNVVHTSLLKRANRTMQICLKEMDLEHVPIYYSWRLNERHYGSLQGLNKAETAKKYGALNNFFIFKLAKRQSFIIDPEGTVRRVYRDVTPSNHAQEIKEDLRAFERNS